MTLLLFLLDFILTFIFISIILYNKCIDWGISPWTSQNSYFIAVSQSHWQNTWINKLNKKKWYASKKVIEKWKKCKEKPCVIFYSYVWRKWTVVALNNQFEICLKILGIFKGFSYQDCSSQRYQLLSWSYLHKEHRPLKSWVDRYVNYKTV